MPLPSTIAAQRKPGEKRASSHGQRGATLIYVIVVMSVISALGAGVLSMTSSSSFTQLNYNNRNRAKYLAEAGILFFKARAKELGGSANGTNIQNALNGQTFTLPGTDGSFTLTSVQYVSATSSFSVQSKGTARSGGAFASNYQIGDSIPMAGSGGGPDIAFDTDMQYFSNPISSRAGAYVASTSGRVLSIGANLYNAFGANWYTGNKFSSSASNEFTYGGCVNGVCNFYQGIRVYYTYKFNGGSAADGFVFTVMSGKARGTSAYSPSQGTRWNDIYTTGGDERFGEMIGYAGTSACYDTTCNGSPTSKYPVKYVDYHNYGNGTIRNGWGITPPKIGIQFDAWTNGNSMLCPNNNYDSWDTRNDPYYTRPATAAWMEDNISYVYWGRNGWNTSTSGASQICTTDCGTTSGKCPHCDPTYDDNRHGRGGNLGAPVNNPPSTDTTMAYFFSRYKLPNGLKSGGGSDQGTNWMSNGQRWAVRHEIIRPLTVNGTSGLYDYRLRTWVRFCGTSSGTGNGAVWTADPESTNPTVPNYTGCQSVNGTKYGDVTISYNPRSTSGTSPNEHKASNFLEETMSLNAADHSRFGRMLFGWTEATGGATQNATIKDFRLTFIRDTYKGIDNYPGACGTSTTDQTSAGYTLCNDTTWPAFPYASPSRPEGAADRVRTPCGV